MTLNKIFYFDVETTGLDPKRNDIIQLAYIVEINGEIKEEGEFRLQPMNYATIEKGALEVNKITIEQLKTYPQPQAVHGQIVNLLDKYVDKYNKKDKFLPAGYNVKFDMDMFRTFFFKNNHKYFGSYFGYHMLDPVPFLMFLEYKGLIKLESYKLVDVCKYFGIELDAHNALSDIKATRKLIHKLMGYLKEVKNEK